MKITAIYVRQSLEKDGSLSLDTQKDTCKTVLSDKEIKNLEIFEDEGYSGKNTNRPSINRLIAKVEKDEVAKIVVYKLDRISRNISDFYRLYETMERHDCQFVSATESFDTGSSMGKAMMGILAVFAQMERENIQKRVKDNYYDRIEKRGTWPGGPAPFGFINAKTSESLPTLVPNPEELPAVEYLFQHYSNDLQTSLGGLAKKLFEKGYRAHKRKDGYFDNVTISRILKNPVYVKADQLLYNYLQSQGVFLLNPAGEWDGNTSAHIVNKKPFLVKNNKREYTDKAQWKAYLTNFEGFIDSETFIKVQDRLKSNKQIGRANSTSKLEEFAGKLKCGNCGYAIKIYNGTTLSCYGNKALHNCNSVFHHHGVYPRCELSNIRIIVAREIARYYSVLLTSYKNRELSYKKLEEEKKKLEQRRNNLLNSLEGTIDSNSQKVIIKRMSELSEKINEIDLKCLEFARIDGIEIEKNLEYFNLSLEQRKALINKLIDRIILFDNTKNNDTGKDFYQVKVVWKTQLLDEYKSIENDIFNGLPKAEADKLKSKIQLESFAMMPEDKLHRIVSGKNKQPSKGKSSDPNCIHEITHFSAPIKIGKKTLRKAVRCEYTVDNSIHRIVYFAIGDKINTEIKNVKSIPLDAITTTFNNAKAFNDFIAGYLKNL